MDTFEGIKDTDGNIIKNGMKEEGYFKESEQRGVGQSQVLYHAEAYALMKASQTGNLGKEVTLFVDRQTCPNCRVQMHRVMDYLGIEKLTIESKYGETLKYVKTNEGDNNNAIYELYKGIDGEIKIHEKFKGKVKFEEE